MTAGFRICKRGRKVDPATVAAFATIPVANVSDCMSRMFAGCASLRPLSPAPWMGGPALTVSVRPGDNLMLHKAIDIAEPGDVIVVDGGGELSIALMGEIMLSLAITRGVAGFVIDGAVRDADAIREAGLPLYAAGVTHRGPYKDGPGEINLPVTVGGMIVAPGDLMLGDGDGVLAVPCDMAQEVLAEALKRQASEALELAAISEGRLDRAWVDAALRAKGCSFEE